MNRLRLKLRNKWNRSKNLGEKYLAEWTGSRSRAMKGRDNLDTLLEERLPAKGTYIEAGALDGFDFSNTYFLDRCKGWNGLLVEPNPMQFQECRRFRSRASVVHCALVPFDYREPTVKITYGHDLTWTAGAYKNDELAGRQAMLETYALSGEQIDVPACTLQSLIDKFLPSVTFFSLDVEGFETQVLQGLDFKKSAPNFLLVECQDADRYQSVRNLLGDRYADGEKLTHHDYLFRLHE